MSIKQPKLLPGQKPPLARSGHASLTIHPDDNRLFFFGGAHREEFLDDIISLDTNTLKWATFPTYRTPRPRAYAR